MVEVSAITILPGDTTGITVYLGEQTTFSAFSHKKRGSWPRVMW